MLYSINNWCALHSGGCGDSGRLSKAEIKALKVYQPSLKLYADPQQVQQTLDWVNSTVAARRQKAADGSPQHAV